MPDSDEYVKPTLMRNPDRERGTTAPITPQSRQFKNLNPYSLMIYGLLPFFSPEQRGGFANELKMTEPDLVLPPDYLPPPAQVPTNITGAERAQYLSSERGTQVLAALENIRNVRGSTPSDMGPGYQYLVEAVGELKRLGGQGTAMSRQNYVEFITSIDSIVNRMKTSEDASKFIPLVQAIANPAFSAGPLMNVGQSKSGKFTFGAPNPELFG